MPKLTFNGDYYKVDGRPFMFNKDSQYILNINGESVVCHVKQVRPSVCISQSPSEIYRHDLYFTRSILGRNTHIAALPFIRDGLVEIIF